jgi:D-alanyl-D-alanine carboxypeptidase
MYKKFFGIVLIAHLLVLGYLGLRTDSPPDANENSDDRAIPSELGMAASEEDDILIPVSAAKPEPTQRLVFDDSSPNELPASLQNSDLRTGLLVEVPSGRILWQKDSDQPVEIASMTKMMTALLAFEDVDAREEIAFSTPIKVTNAAYRIGGSQVWLDPRETFTLEELLVSVMVKSANDSAYLVGEYLAGGDMGQFIDRMNERAQELEMTNTRFRNAHGLPEKTEDNLASCLDLARLSAELLRHEKAIEWASLETYAFRANAKEPTILSNHNRLLSTTIGVDGMKTGYTKRAGYCIAATCERNDRRLIAITTGFSSGSKRDAFTRDLLDWGYTLP